MDGWQQLRRQLKHLRWIVSWCVHVEIVRAIEVSGLLRCVSKCRSIFNQVPSNCRRTSLSAKVALASAPFVVAGVVRSDMLSVASAVSWKLEKKDVSDS